MSFALLALAACGGGGDAPTTPTTKTLPPTTGPAPAIHVSGNRLVTASGTTIRLRGVDHSGTEFQCIHGYGIFDGPSDSASLAAPMAQWRVNAVRVPLNESCWLGLDSVQTQFAGANYQQAIEQYVSMLNRAGFVVILDLHWSMTDTSKATGQAPMPNRAHTPQFWSAVATAFKGNDAVVFDLFNEPYPDNNSNSAEAWRCWRDGGTCSGMGYTAAGMQELITAVRGTGATNVIMLGGVQYANSLSSWLANKPTDPLDNLAASWHVYNFNACNSETCWNANAAPVAQQVPLILGELGDDRGTSAFVTSLMNWMDARGGSYLAWGWNTWNQSLDLITSYNGTPTAYGTAFQTRFKE